MLNVGDMVYFAHSALGYGRVQRENGVYYHDSGLFRDVCMAALCACVYLLGLGSWLEWIRVLYAIAAIALGIVIAVNREVIRRSKDEMVKYMLGKIDTLLLRASEVFAFALVIVTAIWLEGNGGAVAALLCIWLFAVFTARLIMFRRYDRAGIE